MWLSNVRKTAEIDSGFTLIEMIVVVLIIGIASAMAIPSVLSSLDRTKLDSALTTLRGTLEEAQREAIKQGKSCAVTVDPVNKTIAGYIVVDNNGTEELKSGCLITGDRKLDSQIVVTPNTATTIRYSFKGNTISDAAIVLGSSDSPTAVGKRCLVVSEGVGILRTGIYDGTTADPIDQNKCRASL